MPVILADILEQKYRERAVSEDPESLDAEIKVLEKQAAGILRECCREALDPLEKSIAEATA